MIYKTKYLDDRLLNPSGYVNQPISFHPYLTYIENKDNKKTDIPHISARRKIYRLVSFTCRDNGLKCSQYGDCTDPCRHLPTDRHHASMHSFVPHYKWLAPDIAQINSWSDRYPEPCGQS